MTRKKKSNTVEKVLQIKIVLQGITPPIWRRVAVPKDAPLGDLHCLIQHAMGWENEHLHEFEDRQGYRFGPCDPDYPPDDPDLIDEDSVRIDEVLRRAQQKILYTYDFGDDWKHEVQLEKSILCEAGVDYPTCIAGARACPPEDCGGLYGYWRLVEESTKKSPEEYDEPYCGCLSEGIDWEAFEPSRVNAQLARYRSHPTLKGSSF